MALLRILPDVTGSRILKVAATKPEVLISQLLDNISTVPFGSWTPKMGLAVGTPLISCLEAESKYFRFGGCHLEIPTFGYIGKYSP